MFDYVTAALQRAATTDGEQCEDCQELPDGWPCADCYISGEKEIMEGQ